MIAAEYRIAERPAGRVLVDYDQNAWGRTLASAYSPRPPPLATLGDLWAPLLAKSGRFDLEPLLRPIR